MRRAKVLLHTAYYESFGYVLTEAAANGCHVVSTEVGIAPQIAECATTFEGMCNRLRWALERPPLQAPEVPYTMDTTVQQYWKLYENTIADFEK
jgi:glycosyltransferase involved in cell wall biosynthesis